MNQKSLTDRIVTELDRMPGQLQTAAHYVLEHPNDVALLSMREQARRAGLQPATMTRFAKRLGLDGYEALRAAHADAIRTGKSGFSAKAGDQVTHQRLKGDRALATEIASALATQIGHLADPEMIDSLVGMAAVLHQARRIYCMGLRSCHPVAWHLHYICSLFRDHIVLLDQMGGAGTDAIQHATPKDVLFVASVKPYTRLTVDIASYAAERGIPLLALTDNKASPLARNARHTLFVNLSTPSFYHTLTPAFALMEILASLVAGRGGENSVKALARTDELLSRLQAHWSPVRPRRTPRRSTTL